MCGRWSESATSSWARDQDPDLIVTLEFYIKTVRLLARLLQNVAVSLPLWSNLASTQVPVSRLGVVKCRCSSRGHDGGSAQLLQWFYCWIQWKTLHSAAKPLQELRWCTSVWSYSRRLTAFAADLDNVSDRWRTGCHSTSYDYVEILNISLHFDVFVRYRVNKGWILCFEGCHFQASQNCSLAS